MNRGPHVPSVLLVLLGAASYGCMSTVVKLAMDDGWSAPQVTLQQMLSGTVLLWAAAAFGRGGARSAFGAPAADWAKLGLIGASGMALSTVLYNEALARLDASLAIVLLFQFTWITILLESLRSRRLPKPNEWVATGFIVVGTILAVGVLERRGLARWDAAGLAFGLLAAVSYSLFLWLTGLVRTNMPPVARSAVMSTAALAFVLASNGAAGHLAWSGSLSLVGWGAALGILGTALPTVCMNIGIPRIGSNLAALLGSVELPVSVLLAYALLGEPLSGWQTAGVALILAGMIAAQREPASGRKGDAAVGGESEE